MLCEILSKQRYTLKLKLQNNTNLLRYQMKQIEHYSKNKKVQPRKSKHIRVIIFEQTEQIKSITIKNSLKERRIHQDKIIISFHQQNLQLHFWSNEKEIINEMHKLNQPKIIYNNIQQQPNIDKIYILRYLLQLFLYIQMIIKDENYKASKKEKIIRIYIQNNKSKKMAINEKDKQILYTIQSQMKQNNRAILGSVPFKKIILLKKKLDQETLIKENHIKRIKREQQSLLQKIQNHQNEKRGASSSLIKQTRKRSDTTEKLIIEQPKPIRYQKSNKSLYEIQKSKHFQNLRNENNLYRNTINEKKIISLKEKQQMVNKAIFQKEKQKHNIELYQELKKLKVQKEKETEYLKYSELNLQSFYRKKKIETQQQIELDKLEYLRALQKKILNHNNKSIHSSKYKMEQQKSL